MKRIIFSLTSLAFTMFTSLNGNAQIITTVAGNGTSAYSGDNGMAIAAGIHMPVGVSFDSANTMYINDNFNLRVRKVDKYGIITTFAGNGTSGYSGDGGPATLAQLTVVGDVATDNFGNIYIVDPGNDVIRMVNAEGIISTIVGNGANGYSGDNGPATAAELNLPQSIALDDTGNIYIADGNNNCIRKVNTAGIIRTIAGNGTAGCRGDGGPASAALLNSPEAVSVDHAGNIYIADFMNNKIRKINTSGIITTFAGSGSGGYSGDGGLATAARLTNPTDVDIDAAGNIYIADGNNVIRMVNTAGIISTIAGSGHQGFSGDGGPATAAKFNNPECVSVDKFGAIYVADANNNRIRKIESCSSFAVSPVYGATTNVCPGASITFSDNAEGSVWGAGNGNATIAAGVVTGVSAGTDSIYVSVSNSCGTKDTFVVVTVNPMPDAGTLTGSESVCMAATTSLTTSALGGTWNATNGNATVADGTVTGIAAGNDTISYTVINSCGIATTALSIMVNPLPEAGSIAGNDSVEVAAEVMLRDTVGGGIWTSSNPSIAVITTPATVTGIARGIDTIAYTVTNTCGTAITLKVMNVYKDSTTGTTTENLLPTGLQVYPNPAHGICTIATPANVISITLVDAMGRVVLTKKIAGNKGQPIAIDLAGVVTGTYIINIECTDGIYNQKLEIRE